jgi:hypothetical protein
MKQAVLQPKYFPQCSLHVYVFMEVYLNISAGLRMIQFISDYTAQCSRC